MFRQGFKKNIKRHINKEKNIIFLLSLALQQKKLDRVHCLYKAFLIRKLLY